jgi:AmmeMemoRadiSam system protein B
MRREVRQPAVAGHFYPADPVELRRSVEELIADVRPTEAGEEPWAPEAIIAPHAGYVYSGPVAATAYAEVARMRDRVERVVLLGPAHRVPIHGLALPGASAFATPLGDVPLDPEGVRTAEASAWVSSMPEAHAGEHSLEVHLPFLQVVLGDFTLVPMVVGSPEPEHVAEVLQALWGGPESLVVVSSDLSHFLSYEAARALDRRTAESIESLDGGSIGRPGACGRIAVMGLLQVDRQRGLRARRLDLRNSGDTSGGHRRVVGYGSWAFGA